jgi:hypothetical protein
VNWYRKIGSRGQVNGKPVIYPVKTVNEIYRIRLVDGSEWLKSRQIWKGLDTAGNEIDLSMNHKEMYDCGRPMYSLKPEDPKDKAEMPRWYKLLTESKRK